MTRRTRSAALLFLAALGIGAACFLGLGERGGGEGILGEAEGPLPAPPAPAPRPLGIEAEALAPGGGLPTPSPQRRARQAGTAAELGSRRFLDADGRPVLGLRGTWAQDGLVSPLIEGAEGRWALPEVTKAWEPGWTLVAREGGPTWREVGAFGGEEGSGDRRWDDGTAVEGRVLRESDGTPMADLPLVVGIDPHWDFAFRREEVDLEAWSRAGPTGREPPALVRTRTDAQGRWRARVARVPVGVAADPTTESGRAWFLAPSSPGGPTSGAATTPPLRHLAHPLLVVAGQVTDAGTGEPLRAATLTVGRGWHERGTEVEFTDLLSSGRFEYLLARGTPLSEGVTVEVSASAPGYVPATQRSLVGAGEGRVEVALRLQPVGAQGGSVRVQVTIHDEDGEPSALAWFLEIGAPTDLARRLSVTSMVPQGAGTFVAEVPPGEWRLRALLPQPFADLYAASARVRVEAEHPPTVALRVPRGGPVTLTLVGAEPTTPDPWSLETPRAGTTWWRAEGFFEPTASVRFLALPEGPHAFRLARPDGAHGKGVTVEVRKGTETTAELKAP